MNSNEKQARSYKSPLITKYLQNIDQQKLLRTRKRMLTASAIGEKMKEKGWKKKNLAIAFNISLYELDKWLSGTHEFSEENMLFIQNILEIEHC